jgi:hypothetical protein
MTAMRASKTNITTSQRLCALRQPQYGLAFLSVHFYPIQPSTGFARLQPNSTRIGAMSSKMSTHPILRTRLEAFHQPCSAEGWRL